MAFRKGELLLRESQRGADFNEEERVILDVNIPPTHPARLSPPLTISEFTKGRIALTISEFTKGRIGTRQRRTRWERGQRGARRRARKGRLPLRHFLPNHTHPTADGRQPGRELAHLRSHTKEWMRGPGSMHEWAKLK